MKAATLLYHDVIADGTDVGESGRPGGPSATFKLSVENFAAHLDAIQEATSTGPILVDELDADRRQRPGPSDEPPFLLTFDDGGVSAHSVIADRLEARGWRGHFLVTSGYVGEPGFLSREQIRDLRDRGHLIGTHSATHPTRMSTLGRDELVEEWSRSMAALSDILGDPVKVGSVPGGYYSRPVAEAAATAGLDYLFTSEPTVRVENVEGCLVLGRFSLRRGSDPRRAAGFARGDLWRRVPHAAMWQAKKIAKAVGGEAYLKLRSLLVR